ncbi:WD40-repeat-containing domain protein [Gorgonomyces haynaldii]|nr:WD40-repeat-containing domain protein [Gorgonomyces haynaldii]
MTTKKSHLAGLLHRKNPESFREVEFDTTGLDKVFTAAWLSDTNVVYGTKCNQIVVLNTKNGKKVVIPTSHTPQTVISAPRSGYLEQQCSGIHSLAINDNKTLLAVGYGDCSENIQIYSLPSFELIAMLSGHTDMVFSVQWVDNNTLVSGSRDRHVKMWKVPSLEPTGLFDIPVISPADSRVEHRDKVRDLILDKKLGQIYTLSADGTVKIWDCNRPLGQGVRRVPLVHTNETVCMALDQTHHVVAVGSQSHVSLLDYRIGSIVHIFDSLDDGWGVRSLDISHGVVTVGGGLGRLSFYDLRQQKYLHWDTNLEPAVKDANLQTMYRQSTLDAGKGWLKQDTIYMTHFQGIDVKNAIYTCKYSPCGRGLFAAGGPLQLNLRGSYSALWA